MKTLIVHHATPLKAKLTKQEAFDPLDDVGIPFYYVRGNHGSSAGDELLEEINGEIAVNLDELGSSVGSEARLFDIDHHPDRELPWNELTFPEETAEPTSVLILHQTIEQLSGPGPQSVDLYRISRRYGGKFDFIISGHHHDAIGRAWNGVPVVYSGAAEHMSTNKNPVDRVLWLVTITDGSLSYERYDLPE